jgi:integrase
MANSSEHQPTIGIGTIFCRGASGKFYFESKANGITATSLKTSDPHEAEREARKRFGYLSAEDRAEQLSEATVRLSVERGVISDAKRPRINLTESEVYGSYLSVLQRTNLGRDRHEDAISKTPLSPKTLKEVKGYIRRFCQWIQTNHSNVTTMDQVTVAVADAYLDSIRSKFSANTYNRYLVNLRTVWKRLAVRAGLESNVWGKFEQLHAKQVNAEKVSKQPFSFEQLETIKEKAEGWVAVAVSIGLETALRLSDVTTLRVEQIDTAEGFITKRTRKGAKTQTFYIPDSLPLIRAWVADGQSDGEYLFPELAAYQLGLDRNQDDSEVAGRFSAFLRDDCGITTTVEGSDGKKHTVLGFHSLRVSNATYSHSNGKSVSEVQTQLGHSSEATTDGYIQEDQATIRARVKASYRPLPTSKLSRLEIIKQGVTSLTEKEAEELHAWLSNILKG